MMKSDKYYSEVAGDLFETDMIWMANKVYENHPIIKVKDGTEKEDKFEGTDQWIGKLRVDYTSNFSQKDHTKDHYDTGIDLGGFELMFSTRLGNNIKTFKNKVLVIGINCKNYNDYQDRILECVAKRKEEIFKMAREYAYKHSLYCAA